MVPVVFLEVRDQSLVGLPVRLPPLGGRQVPGGLVQEVDECDLEHIQDECDAVQPESSPQID